MKHILSFLTASVLCTSVGHAENFAAAAAPKTGLVAIVDGSESYLTFGYYDWGPDWSGVKREQSAEEAPGEARFTYRNTLQQSNTAFEIQGSWKQSAPDSLRFEAVLTPAASADLVMAQFSLDAPAGFTGSATAADGSVTELKFPIARGELAMPVKTLSLTDTQGRTTTLSFDRPANLSADGQIRMILVEKQMKKGQTYPLAFTLKLPAATGFFPGPSSVPDSTKGWFEFTGKSPIPSNSEWNLSTWLEAPAGKHGRITRKDDLLIYHNKPIKLWGINNSYSACAPDTALADRRADFYAAMGINSVRLHKYADGAGWAGIQSKDSAAVLDPAGLERMDYFIAALKKRGIYTKLSPVFIMKIGPADLAAIPYAKELGEMRGDRINPRHGSFYLSTELQNLLRDQVVSLLKHKNPHTGLTYAEDPAIAYVEIYNEDDALFGGVSSVMAQSPTLRARGGKMFSDWLKKKYGTEQAFMAAWGDKALNCSILTNQKIPTDESWANGRIYPAGNPWFFDPDNLETSQKNYKQRLLDTMTFLYELQNDVYARYTKAIRAAGYQGEMISSNWQAGRAMSHFYNLHSDSLIGTIDRHNYFGGGDRFHFNSASMLAVPGGGSLSSSLQQVGNLPFMLSEWIHVFPNEWGVEGPAILGAYGMGLQGWDVSYPFQNRDNGTFSTAIGSETWDAAAPNFIGIFPAVSRQVLRGDVKESEVVHTRNVHAPSLAKGELGFDEKVAQQWDIKTFDSDVFPAAALAAARGVVRFTEKPEPTAKFDLAPYSKADAILSSTGELAWNAGSNSQDGCIRINTAGTQALVGFTKGFAKGATVVFTDATISSGSRYGAIYLSARSPDGTIAKDKAVLITAIARARNAGSAIVGDSLLLSRGEERNGRPLGPVMMEPVAATIRLKRGGNPVVHILDHNGVKTGRTLPVKNASIEIDTGRDATPYYLVEW